MAVNAARGAYKLPTLQQAPTLSDFYNKVRENPSNPNFILDVVGEEIQVVEPEGCCFSFSSSPSAIERAVGRRAWEAFERAIGQEGIHDRIRNSRLERMQRRYGLDFNQLREAGHPLLVEHVEKFAVSSAKLFHQDLITLAGRNAFSRDEVGNFTRAIQNTEFVGNSAPPHELRGGPDSFGDHFWHDPFKLDRKRVHLSWPEDVEHLTIPDHLHNQYNYLPKDLPWINRLAMVFTSLEMEVGELIPAPANGGGIDYYRVFEKIGTGDGLVAYALKPVANDSELTPLIVFRPSQLSLVAEDAIETLFNDMEANIGETGYHAARPLFARLMQDQNFHNGQKILLIGYSLGSSQAQRFLKEFWRQVFRAMLINGPSIDRVATQDFADEMNNPNLAIEGDPLKIEIYRNREDIADKAGETHLGWGVLPEAPVELSLVEFQNAPLLSNLLGSHSYRPFEPAHLSALQGENEIGVPHLYPRDELNVQLDNFQRGPEIEWYERTRQFWGTQVLYNITYGLYAFVKAILACFGIQLFRSSRHRCL